MNPFVKLKAEELLAATSTFEAPVDVSRIAKHLNIEVRKEFFVGSLSGVLMRRSGDTVVAVNAGDPPKRQRFTMAHEIGHFALGHKGDVFVDHTIMNRRDARSSAAIDSQEIEANAFAAELLMPTRMVLDKVNKILAADPEISQEEIVASLAQAFNVSEQAMNYRLINLGLLGI